MTNAPLCPACQRPPTPQLLCDSCLGLLPASVRTQLRRAWDAWAGDDFGDQAALGRYNAAAAAAVEAASDLVARTRRHETRVEAILAGKETW